eukprot:3260593-Alexandrium_andersonii.AAC.1
MASAAPWRRSLDRLRLGSDASARNARQRFKRPLVERFGGECARSAHALVPGSRCGVKRSSTRARTRPC